VKIGFKFQSLSQISNISTSDPQFFQVNSNTARDWRTDRLIDGRGATLNAVRSPRQGRIIMNRYGRRVIGSRQSVCPGVISLTVPVYWYATPRE